MPIGFSPDDVAVVGLPCFNKGKAPADCPRFRFRFLTSGQAKKVERLRDAARAANRDDECDRLLNEAIRIGLVGWENLKDGEGKLIPFAPAPVLPSAPAEPLPRQNPEIQLLATAELYDVLDEFTIRLKFQITLEYPRELLYTDAESFRSSSPSPAGTASSAKDAPAENAQTLPA
jgi:hypothetical protein